ncbi:NYN domain-containing protein [Citricoccus sp. SGAir0253]|uniref:NYN domain-containing protein n=1 Tax=Citricoccus sp. SGAir0253 TaxID=2567881 RepID=UPI0010CD4A04|nr:NYN domain-containing protein [Citricoccus sp. SGAir0253]QCU77716.1 NYN domain-containing protein [Citricoccus sp. SGAir0253]
MTDSSSATTRIAVLIDCDNVSPAHAGAILEELATYGTATVKRAYGDWTTTNLGGWKKALNDLAIQPVQQFAYTAGKNSTDSALIIEAMDLLWMGHVDTFALVSSDSDFTRLATRLRESGKRVIGLGERKTPVSLRHAVDQFIYLELLGAGDPDDGAETEAPVAAPVAGSEGGRSRARRGSAAAGGAAVSAPSAASSAAAGAAGAAASSAAGRATGGVTGGSEDAAGPAGVEPAGLAGEPAEDASAPRINLQSALMKAVNATSGDDGWAHLSQVGQHLSRAHVDFDPRDFGHRKLSTLVAEQPYLEHRTEGGRMQVALKRRAGRR